MKKGFTLLELLIVMAILAILASILLVVVKPQQIFAKARDTQRKTDLANISKAIDIYSVETPTGADLGECLVSSATSTLYTSATGGSTNVADLPAGSGFSALVNSTAQTVDGTGWIPVNFSGVASLNLANLPVDPQNGNHTDVNGKYYSYGCKSNTSYEINARLETLTDGANDGGNNTAVYEVGTDKTILPATTSAAFYPAQ